MFKVFLLIGTFLFVYGISLYPFFGKIKSFLHR